MKIAGRYEITAKVGQGGMGVVYRAYDPAPMDREVAVKTLHEFADPLALDLFYRECRALKSISHPNIVEIFDMGEFEEGGQKRPYFVMPLLPGQTLDELIRKASHRLTVDRVVEIISQTCRGLQAAHDHGLVHRDLKPSNIFVMADDSVKLIDFGVAHAVTARSRTTGYDKGTLLYMAPEQLQHKPVSAQSDIYALGLTAYEALTRRQPFRGATESDVVQAILNYVPPPASELNPAVSQVMSRAVHKAISKQPWSRYETAREFADTLQKALRNEPIAMFDPGRMQPRIQTALKALERGDEQFAGEIVSELESEGNADPQIAQLRGQIDRIVRQKSLAQLLESARARYEEEEYPLALQKIHDVLQIDPGNETALGLKARIEDRRGERQFETWIDLARQHVANHDYGHAHHALQNAIALRPDDPRISRVMAEVQSAEQASGRMPGEQRELQNRGRAETNIPTIAPGLEPTLLKPPSGTKVPSLEQPAPERTPHAPAQKPPATAQKPPAPAQMPAEKTREPFSLRQLAVAGAAIAALLTVAVVGFVWQSRAPVASSPAAVPAAPSPSPAADSTPAPVPVAVPEEAPAPVQTTTPTPPPPPAPIVPPSIPAPAAGRAPNPTVGSPARPRAADAPRTTDAAPAPKPVATPPPPSIPATAPAPAPSPAADRTPAATATTPNTTPVDAPLPPVLAAARAAQLLEQGSQSEKAEDWPAALRYYERARAMDPSLGGLASAAVARVQTQMFADGADAFKRAQQFEALNRVNDAITWYERAVRNLPDSSPEKRTATDRLRVLKAGR